MPRCQGTPTTGRHVKLCHVRLRNTWHRHARPLTGVGYDWLLWHPGQSFLINRCSQKHMSASLTPRIALSMWEPHPARGTLAQPVTSRPHATHTPVPQPLPSQARTTYQPRYACRTPGIQPVDAHPQVVSARAGRVRPVAHACISSTQLRTHLVAHSIKSEEMYARTTTQEVCGVVRSTSVGEREEAGVCGCACVSSC